ncbi:MAG: 2-oxoglutarate dehydrogenase complex dihydrolipoyllysine-residue succinyltransferase [Cryomorphaceae bacterium]|nr:2-oxoglutarate dehydrogenase complex dihydrolipoyllysine-residue succinyltransferase [Cryomorphaceae bacterium]
MPVLEMKVPSPGESISEVEIAAWLVKDGDWVEKDQTIAEVDSDKATLELPAESAGVITLKAAEGDVVAVGGVVCLIDTDAARPASAEKPKETAAPAPVAAKAEAPAPKAPVAEKPKDASYASGHPSPAARKLMDENGLKASQVPANGRDGRITTGDVMSALSTGFSAAEPTWGGTRDERREKMSSLRRKIAERLVSVKNETAMLTTFNEVNMQPIMDIRAKYKDVFKEKHGVNLGFMSFFTKAVTTALSLYPSVNARIEGNEIVFHDYADIGIAVSSPKGLMVPVVRNAESMSLAGIEEEIKRLAIRARDGKITIDEMTGGTFTITNGGVFGSMLSTPIINPPQSAILGMHNVVERPVAENGQVVIRPVMYVALSYDHRIIDGKESVSFLVKVKEMLENPEKMLFGSKDPAEVLLGL